MPLDDLPFREIWALDFEFSAPDGERPRPTCLVAWELRSGRKVRVWADELARLREPPYGIGDDCLFVAYYASAEAGCHLALGWPVPSRVLDLFTEFRVLTNGKATPSGAGLLGACAYFGIDAIATSEKDRLRELAMRGGPWTEAERHDLLDYCESDVAGLAALLEKMLPLVDVPRALLRGRYMVAAARMEHVGVPIDEATLCRLKTYWLTMQERLIARVDSPYGVFDGLTFKTDRFEKLLIRKGIGWPRLPSGRLALDDDSFRDMARCHPELAALRELRTSLSQMRLADLAVGTDGRNRCLLSAFRARTGRNQPSSSRFIFGPSVWLRGLIRPTEGQGLAYVDWSQQEFGIAAALSGDAAMMAAYLSGDPYLAFAKQAGAAPPSATKSSHRAIRDQFKACALAVQYGMGPDGLALRVGQTAAHARDLLRLHREIYSGFWHWSQGAVDYANLRGELFTTFGWKVHVSTQANARFLANFPMQANGAEMLRLACSASTEDGIRVCAPVHDAVLIEAPLDELDATVAATQQVMADASAAVLDGFRLRTDATVIRHPDRYADERGAQMWQAVSEVLAEIAPSADSDRQGVRG